MCSTRVFATTVLSIGLVLAFSGAISAQEPSQPPPQDEQNPQQEPAQDQQPGQEPQQQPDLQQQPAHERSQPSYIPQDRSARSARSGAEAASPDDYSNAAPPAGHPADGHRHRDLPVSAYAVVPGTKFLVRLEDNLDSRETQDKAGFTVRTLEPLEAGDGIYLPSGAEIHGHVSRVEPAAMVGRAKIWLTFDDIRTRFGSLPIIAEVIAVPGDPNVRTVARQEGLIEGRTNGQQAAAQAAATAAALAAVKTMNTHDKRAIAEAAATAAIAAYMAELNRGRDLVLARGEKLELQLERPLYLLKDRSRL